jgi:hypothetical protein
MEPIYINSSDDEALSAAAGMFEASFAMQNKGVFSYLTLHNIALPA